MAQRRQHGGAFKTRVVVEVIGGHKTAKEIAGAYEIHPSHVAKWKADALSRLPEVLSDGRTGKAVAERETEARLYQEIGHNRVRRLLRVMGLEAIYPKPRLSVPGGWRKGQGHHA